MRYPFIVLEGISGVGKTTLASHLAAAMKGIVYKTPPFPFSILKGVADRLLPWKFRYWFYTLGNFLASWRIACLLKHSPIVCDRYTLTTQNIHRLVGVQVLREEILNRWVLQPDLSVMITCRNSDRLDRLDMRGRSYCDKIEKRLKLDDRLEQTYRFFGLPEIDNTGPINDSIQQIIALLNTSRCTLMNLEKGNETADFGLKLLPHAAATMGGMISIPDKTSAPVS